MPEPVSMILGGLALWAKKHAAVQAVHAAGAHMGATHAAATTYYDPTTGMNYVDPSSASQSFNPLDNNMVDDKVEKYVEKRSQKKRYAETRSKKKTRATYDYDCEVICDVCDDSFSSTISHYHCDRCYDGNFDICSNCFDEGYYCRRDSHDLRKRKQLDGRWVSRNVY